MASVSSTAIAPLVRAGVAASAAVMGAILSRIPDGCEQVGLSHVLARVTRSATGHGGRERRGRRGERESVGCAGQVSTLRAELEQARAERQLEAASEVETVSSACAASVPE